MKPGAGTGPTGPVRLARTACASTTPATSSTNGNKVQIWTCNGGAAQNWTYAEDGTLRIHGKCLDATGYGTKAGTKLQLWSCTNHTNQMWTPANAAELTSTLSGLCLSAPSDDVRNGDPGGTSDCPVWQRASRRRRMDAAGRGDMSGVPGKCITDSGGGTANGTKIVLEPCADSSAQRWTVDPDGTIRIFGKCLVLATAVSGSGAILWTCGGAGHIQQWQAPRHLGTGSAADLPSAGSSAARPLWRARRGETANGTQLHARRGRRIAQWFWDQALTGTSGSQAKQRSVR